MIVRASDKHPREIAPDVWRSVLGHGERLMLVEVTMKRGAKLPLHSHVHEQVSYIVHGLVQFQVGDQPVVLAAGESYAFASGQAHAAEALSDCTVVDAFSPPREDFLAVQ